MTTPRAGLIGMIVPLVGDAYFAAIMAGAAEAAFEHELRLVLEPTLHQHAREVSLRERLMRGTDGTLLILPEESGAELERVLAAPYPLVVVDPKLALGAAVPCVLAAHRAGAEQAVRHLLGLGHRRIAAIFGPPAWLASAERRAGYRAVLADAGIAPDLALEVDADPETAAGELAATALLAAAEPPTAIFAFNDAIAIGALRAARVRGLRVPNELSIVGVDDLPAATIVEPALTTVRQPLAELGRAAIGQLTLLLENGRLETPHVELATRLVIRETTAPPPR